MKHFWQGAWINDLELKARIAELSTTVETLRAKEPLPSLHCLLAACEELSKLISDAQSPVHRGLVAVLADEGRSPAEAADTLTVLARFLDRDVLEKRLRRELMVEGAAHIEEGALERVDYSQDLFEGWEPLGFTVHVAPANAATVAPLSALEALLAGNSAFVKLPGSAGSFCGRFFEALCATEKGGVLQPHLFAAAIPSSDQVALTALLAVADGVSAWGGDESIAAIRKLTPPAARLIDWGHKISFAYVTASKAADAPAAELELLARDVCLLEQQACSSPQVVYVETETEDGLRSFAGRFASALTAVAAAETPSLTADLQEKAQVSRTGAVHSMEACLEGSPSLGVMHCGGARIFLSLDPCLEASPLFRSVWLKPLSRREIIPTLRPHREKLQTVGLLAQTGEMAALAPLFFRAGATRVTPAGSMPDGYEWEPHDGLYALSRYASRVSLRWHGGLRGVSRLSELAAAPTPPERPDALPTAPIMGKAAFQDITVADRHSRLHVKSGGSSGQAKLSRFTYEDYELQMHMAAQGLYAAGLDPTWDRCMNLFFAGHMYGGFLSFFTILERLGAAQFPMGAITGTDEVADAIIEHRVNAILGMPSYVLGLFREQEERLAKERVVTKIFYGGEHFSEAQRRWLTDRFGVRLIRSAAYGSVDAGPIGFQCAHCEGSVHHLHGALHDLEILDLERDAPAARGAEGRLVLSVKHRRGQPIRRYDLGDVGRLLEGPCPCGRTTPRFELLGRQGDAFRAAGMFLNYGKLSRLAEQVAACGGISQIHIDHDGMKEHLELWFAPQHPRAGAAAVTMAQELERALPDLDRDLGTLLQEDRSLRFTARVVMANALLRSPSSDKVLHVVDHRKPRAEAP